MKLRNYSRNILYYIHQSRTQFIIYRPSAIYISSRLIKQNSLSSFLIIITYSYHNSRVVIVVIRRSASSQSKTLPMSIIKSVKFLIPQSTNIKYCYQPYRVYLVNFAIFYSQALLHVFLYITIVSSYPSLSINFLPFSANILDSSISNTLQLYYHYHPL